MKKKRGTPMNKTPWTVLLICLLASCSGSSKPEEEAAFSWVTPTGAPTLAFFDQGDNPNWVSASNPSEVVVPSFAANAYDGIVFDGVSGLTMMAKNEKAANYKLARWINNLGFYLVSTSHAKEEIAEWNTSWTIDAFVKTGNASRCLLSLAENVWNWGGITSQVTFEVGVDSVVSNIPANGYDFYLVADPAYTNLKSKMGDRLHLIYDLQEEWGKAHAGAKIPSAALFLKSQGLIEHPSSYAKFLDETDKRLQTLVDAPEKAKAALQEYAQEDPSHLVNGALPRFGIASSIVENLPNLQSHNAFGFIKKEDAGDVRQIANSFSEALGGPSFGDEFFC